MELDCTQWVFTIWYPFVLGDHSVAEFVCILPSRIAATVRAR